MSAGSAGAVHGRRIRGAGDDEGEDAQQSPTGRAVAQASASSSIGSAPSHAERAATDPTVPAATVAPPLRPTGVADQSEPRMASTPPSSSLCMHSSLSELGGTGWDGAEDSVEDRSRERHSTQLAAAAQSLPAGCHVLQIRSTSVALIDDRMGVFRSKHSRPALGSTSSSSPSPLQLLADVELQSCMHFLTSRDLISLTRCDRRLRSLGKSKFAWAHTWLHFHASSHKIEPAFLQQLQLYPHLAMSWLAVDASHHGVVAWLDALGDRVRSLHVPSIDASRGPQIGMLMHPSLLKLEELIVRSSTLEPTMCSTLMIEAIAALPNLKRLDITPVATYDTQACFAALEKAPSLTSLCIADTETGKASLLPRIAACNSLVHLRLSYPQLYGDQFVKFFSSVHMRCLQSLSLHRFHLHGGGSGAKTTDLELRTAFEGMRFLHTLSLSLCNSADALIAHLHWFPRLELVRIQSSKNPSTAPSVAALVSLFESTENLRCFLRYHLSYDLGSMRQSAIDGHRDRYTKDKRLAPFQSRIVVMSQADEFD